MNERIIQLEELRQRLADYPALQYFVVYLVTRLMQNPLCPRTAQLLEELDRLSVGK